MDNKRTKLLLILAFCWYNTHVFSQITFQKTFSDSGNATGTWVIETGNGYLVSGHLTSNSGNQDAILVNFDLSGTVIWQKRFGGSEADFFNAVVKTNGGYVAIGETRSFGAGNVDMFILKVNDSGTLLWSKTIGDGNFDDLARSVLEIPGGDLLISGMSAPAGSGTFGSIFIRLDQNGNLVWSQKLNTGISNLILSNYIEGNTIYASGGLDADGTFLRLDLATGSLLNATSYQGASSEALYYQQPTQDGYLVIADHTRSADLSVPISMWVEKINPLDGQVVWSKVYYRNNDNLRGRIEKVNDGGFLLTPYDNFNSPLADALLVKIDENGTPVWSYNYGGSNSDRIFKAKQTVDGGFIAVGDTRSNSANGASEVLLLKTDANGKIEGQCIQEAGIQFENFEANIVVPLINSELWLDATLLSTAPLLLNLLEQNFTENANPVWNQTIVLCPNESYNIGGVAYFAPQMLSFSSISSNACDTIFNYELLLFPYSTETQNIGLCPGETVTINGLSYAPPAIVLDTVAGLAGGCETIVTYILTGIQPSSSVVNLNSCPGQSVIYNGIELSNGMTQTIQLTNAAGCDSLVTVTVSEVPETIFELYTNASCLNSGTGMLTVTSVLAGSPPLEFSLNKIDFQANTLFSGLPVGAYTVFVRDANGCFYERDTVLESLPALNIQLANGILPCDSAKVELEAVVLSGNVSGLSYTWWDGGQASTTIATEAGTVWVEVTDECETVHAEASVKWAELADDLDIVYIPNVFMPSSKDVVNTEFKPFFAAGIDLLGFHFEVYDRWGNKLFETSSTTEGWDGIFRNQNFNPGVQVWQLDADVAICGRVLHVQRKGDVTVVR